MAAFAVFFIMLVVGENRRIRQNEEKEKELQDALLKANRANVPPSVANCAPYLSSSLP